VELGRAVREFYDRQVNDETDDYGQKSGSNGWSGILPYSVLCEGEEIIFAFGESGKKRPRFGDQAILKRGGGQNWAI
jgi:hypothetical protein